MVMEIIGYNPQVQPSKSHVIWEQKAVVIPTTQYQEEFQPIAIPITIHVKVWEWILFILEVEITGSL